MIKVHLIGFWHNLISGESGGEGGVGLAPFLISILYFKQCWLTSLGHGASGKNGLSGAKWINFMKMAFCKMGSFPSNVFWKVCMLETVLLLKYPVIIVNGKWWDILINAGHLDILTQLMFVSSSECLEDFSARTFGFFRPCFVTF